MEIIDVITPPFHQNRDSNFSDDELVRPCRTWLNVSQNSTKGVGAKSNHLWALIVNFFKKLGGQGVGVCSQQSLESKQLDVQPKMSKFSRTFTSVCDLKMNLEPMKKTKLQSKDLVLGLIEN